MQTTASTSEGATATVETDRLIASDRVEGTAVYDPQGRRLGSIYNFMVDKRSGQAEYAVLSFGGFLGIGDDHYPLPWNSLRYDAERGGYVVDVTEEQLRGAPRYAGTSEAGWADPAFGRTITDYYGIGLGGPY